MISLTATISRPDEIFGTDKDDLGFIVTPHEEINFGHRQTSEEDSGSGQSTIIDKGDLFLQHNQRYASRGLVGDASQRCVSLSHGRAGAREVTLRCRPNFEDHTSRDGMRSDGTFRGLPSACLSCGFTSSPANSSSGSRNCIEYKRV